jgi:hypothetical protein
MVAIKNTPAASHAADGLVCIRIQIRNGAVAIRSIVTMFGGVIGTSLTLSLLDESQVFFVSIRSVKNIGIGQRGQIASLAIALTGRAQTE